MMGKGFLLLLNSYSGINLKRREIHEHLYQSQAFVMQLTLVPSIDLFNKQMHFQSRGLQLVNKRYAVCCLSIEFFSVLLLTILILVLLKTHPLILFQEMINSKSMNVHFLFIYILTQNM